MLINSEVRKTDFYKSELSFNETNEIVCGRKASNLVKETRQPLRSVPSVC